MGKGFKPPDQYRALEHHHHLRLPATTPCRRIGIGTTEYRTPVTQYPGTVTGSTMNEQASAQVIGVGMVTSVAAIICEFFS